MVRANERDVHRQDDAEIVARCPQPRDEARERSAHVGAVLDDLVGQTERVSALPRRKPFVAQFAERSPRACRECLAVELGERLRGPEPAACAADEQDPGQTSRRQGSV